MNNEFIDYTKQVESFFDNQISVVGLPEILIAVIYISICLIMLCFLLWLYNKHESSKTDKYGFTKDTKGIWGRDLK